VIMMASVLVILIKSHQIHRVTWVKDKVPMSNNSQYGMNA